MSAIHGSCLCGKVRYEISGKIELFTYCFCPRCQKASGSAHVANMRVSPDQIKWNQGQENIARYDLPEAERFAHGFCKTCGSPVPWATRNGLKIIVPAGSLDDDPEVKPTNIIYWDHRASWYIDPIDLEKTSLK